MDQGLQVSLGARVLLQEVKQPRGPTHLEGGADQRHIRPGRVDELLACLLQPLLGEPGLLIIPAAQELGELTLRRLPLMASCGIYYRPAG